MKKWFNIVSLLLLSQISLAHAQNDRPLERELERLRTNLQKTVTTLQQLQDFFGSDVRSQIETRLQQARNRFGQAEDLVRNGNRVLATLAITDTYQLLREIEALIKSHPLFQRRFQETLDRKIQQAEAAAGNSVNQESVYLLNQAKFFRHRAYSLAQQDRTYSALEYYRLAIYFADQTLRATAESGSENDLRFWQRYYQETELLLQRAREIENSPDDNVSLKQLLARAEKELEEIRQLVEQKRYELAKQKLKGVNLALYRVIDALEKVPDNEPERLRMELESLRFSLASLKQNAIDPAPAVSALYRRAENLMAKIDDHLRNGRDRLARGQLFFANQLVARLYDMLGTNQVAGSDGQLDRQYSITENQLADLETRAGNHRMSGTFLPLIRNNMEQARLARDSAQEAEASFYLNISNRMILLYNRFLLQDGGQEMRKDMVRTDLERLFELLQRLGEDRTRSGKRGISYENADKLYQLANQAYQDGDYRLANQLTKLAVNILTK